MVTREVYNSRVTSSTIMYNYKSILCDKFSVTLEFWVSHVTQKWLALTCGVSGAIFNCSWTTLARFWLTFALVLGALGPLLDALGPLWDTPEARGDTWVILLTCHWTLQWAIFVNFKKKPVFWHPKWDPKSPNFSLKIVLTSNAKIVMISQPIFNSFLWICRRLGTQISIEFL